MKIFTFLFLTILVLTNSKLSPVITLASKASELDHFTNNLRETEMNENLNLQNVLSTIFTQMQTKNTELIKEELLNFFKKIDENITALNTK
jgi:hypothetical protein